MRQLACFFLLSLFICGCSGKPVPVIVNGELTFGRYIITPPNGYRYFPRKFPTKIKTPKDLFLITFWEDKEVALRKTAPNKIGVFFNFAVSANTYKDFDAYYEAARALGITYKDLPNEAEILKAAVNWSCKQAGQSFYGIECISLGDNLVTIGTYGSDKEAVLSQIPMLQKMVESFRMHKNTNGGTH